MSNAAVPIPAVPSPASVPAVEVVALRKEFRRRSRRKDESRFTRRYRTMPAIRDVSFTMRRGECVAILGQNGSGKSTLVRLLSTLLGRLVGPSTGTNFVGMLRLANEMRAQQQTGSIVSLLCDAGERYLPTYHDAAWVHANFGDCAAACAKFNAELNSSPVDLTGKTSA